MDAYPNPGDDQCRCCSSRKMVDILNRVRCDPKAITAIVTLSHIGHTSRFSILLEHFASHASRCYYPSSSTSVLWTMLFMTKVLLIFLLFKAG